MSIKEPSELKYTLIQAHHYLSLSIAIAMDEENSSLAVELAKIVTSLYNQMKKIP